MTRKAHHMTIGEFNDLMSRIPVHETSFFRRKPSKLQRTWLHMFGEPLLNRDFKDIIDGADKKFDVVGLSTNGTLFTPEISKSILHSKLDILIISLDSVVPEIYSHVRCSAPPLSNVLEGIKTFLVLKNRLNPALRCDIQVIDFPKYPGNTDTFIRYFNALKIPVDDNTFLLVKSLSDFAHQVEIDDTLRLKAVKSSLKRRPCHFPFDRCAIASNGDILACCMDVNGILKMGNLFEMDFYNIWQGNPYQKLRKAHENLNFTNYELCRECDQTYAGLDSERGYTIPLIQDKP